MDRFTAAIKTALDNKNWYAALSLALTMPDICGKIDLPDASPSARYVAWADKWLVPKYTSIIGSQHTEHVFLNAQDCFALRCSYLHAGSDYIADQRIQKALSDFHFCEPSRNGNIAHMNQVDTTLQLQVDLFCFDVIDAVDSWLKTKGRDFPDAAASLLTVWPPLFE